MLCFLGIGSNLGDSKGYVKKAMRRVADFQYTTLLSHSKLYRTKPIGIDSDKWFINAVLMIETSLSPRKLMDYCLHLEQEFGRDRGRGKDRELDIDILYYGNCIVWEQDLKIPHPRLAQRAFVLIPWSDVASGLSIRPWNKTIGTLSKMVDHTFVEELT